MQSVGATEIRAAAVEATVTFYLPVLLLLLRSAPLFAPPP